MEDDIEKWTQEYFWEQLQKELTQEEQCTCYYISSATYQFGSDEFKQRIKPLDWRKNNGKFYRAEIKIRFNVVSESEDSS